MGISTCHYQSDLRGFRNSVKEHSLALFHRMAQSPSCPVEQLESTAATEHCPRCLHISGDCRALVWTLMNVSIEVFGSESIHFCVCNTAFPDTAFVQINFVQINIVQQIAYRLSIQ